MPPLRPLPSQSLRPAWNASQLCRGPPAARRPLPHGFCAAEARSFATASDGADDANASARGDNGSSEGMRDEGPPAASNAGEVKPLIRPLYYQRQRGNSVAGTWLGPVPGQDSHLGDGAIGAAEKPGKHRKATSGSSGKKPRRRNAGDNDRLQRLLGSESSRRAVEQAKGIQTGVITKDTIMDDSTWQRLKQGLTEMAEEEVRPVVVRKVTRSEHRHEKRAEREKAEREKAIEDHWNAGTGKNPLSALKQRNAKQLDSEPRPDPTTVRERLRDAIGNMRSSLSAQIEDDVAPGRYRQDVQHTAKSVQEQRLEELEELLAQASRRLRELQGYRLQDENGTRDNLAITEVSHRTTPTRSKMSRRRETGEKITPVRGGAHATAELDRRNHADASLFGSDPPIRYLSRDPGRPLPHTTGQAIPPAMFGPLVNLVHPSMPKEVAEQGHRTSLLDELFPGEAETGPRKSPQICQESSEERDKKSGLGLVNDVAGNPDVSQSGKQKWTAPLLGELFPELADNSQETQSTPREEREVPKLSLDFQAQKPVKRPNLVDKDQWIDRQMQKNYQNEVVVAQLSGVSKTLNEEDIKRLVPTSSKYIEGWSDPDFIKVIPVRDEQTLERLDRYLILFRTVRAARDFQEHVKKLHTTVKSYAPSSLNSPLPPPPGFHDESCRDINAAMQSYTIGPPSSNFIYCSIIPTPYPRSVRQLLAGGGYEPIISSSAAGVAKVLFHLEGAQPSLADVRRTIARDGKDRWLPWQIVGGTNSADGIVRLTTHLSRDEAVGNDVEALMIRKVAPRYVISFENKAEAQRFVRTWHRVPFRWSARDVYENGEGAPQARAEVLW